MQKRIPVNIIKLLVTWYANSVSAVNWYGIISKSYTLLAGVRQGGVLSPNLFSIYVDMVISAIDGSNLGCQIGTQNMGILSLCMQMTLFLYQPQCVNFKKWLAYAWMYYVAWI